jgi:hypothetical protein
VETSELEKDELLGDAIHLDGRVTTRADADRCTPSLGAGQRQHGLAHAGADA